MGEEVVVRPLTGEEVQEAVIHKIRQSMARSCNLLGTNGYTSFRCRVTISLSLSDYGREVLDNHQVDVAESTGIEPEGPLRQEEAEVIMEPKPPNQVLIESDQKVDLQTTEDGKRVIRQVRYSPRKAPKTP